MSGAVEEVETEAVQCCSLLVVLVRFVLLCFDMFGLVVLLLDSRPKGTGITQHLGQAKRFFSYFLYLLRCHTNSVNLITQMQFIFNE